MPRIRCHYADCVFLDDAYCSAAAVEFDPDTGCATYSPNEKSDADDDEWDDDKEEWDEDEVDDESDLWLDESESEF